MEVTEEQLAEIFFSQQAKIKEQVTQDINPTIETPNILKPTWELMHSDDLNIIVPRAIELGWGDNKVQVKRYAFAPDRFHYYIEPFEQDCQCPNLLRYQDFAPIKEEIEG